MVVLCEVFDLCHLGALQIKGGQRRLKLDERQTAEMIKTSAQPPASCVAQLEKSVNLQARLPEDPTVAAFGMKVAKDMMQVSPICLGPGFLFWFVYLMHIIPVHQLKGLSELLLSAL